MSVVVLTAEQIEEIVRGAVAKGVEEGLSRARTLLQRSEEPVNLEAAMKLAGYSDKGSFRQFCRTYGIMPHEIRARRYFYLPSDLRRGVKGSHIR